MYPSTRHKLGRIFLTELPITTEVLNRLLARGAPAPMSPATLSVVLSMLRPEEKTLLHHGISVTISEAEIVERIDRAQTCPEVAMNLGS